MSIKKKKAELIAEQVAAAVRAGKELHLESVDFSDPNRPKTCLEVDFPILPINQIAQIEGNAGKPIYQMSKWWARRRSSVFRSTLIAAATKAPDDPAEAAKIVWDAYYGNHQKNAAFRHLKVADIFMGGGTTLVEGARLGMQMVGNDLNPVAWLVVKNELTDVDLEEVNKLFDHIEREVKSQIMPFYACEGPGGEKGVWTKLSTQEVMGEDFDPLALAPEERKDYGYEGPEVIYAFWAKHGPCAAPECGHRTPLMSSPVVAVKTLTVKAWQGIPCSHCHKEFDIECQEARMAPDVPIVVADTEKPYTIMDNAGYFTCPYCDHIHHDATAAKKGESVNLSKKRSKNKPIEMTLLVHPEWLKGAPGNDENGSLRGIVTSNVDSTKRWNELRTSTLRLVEVRGKLPEQITCPVTKTTFSTSVSTIPKQAKFTCMADTCGREQAQVDSIEASKQTAPSSVFSLQCFSPSRSLLQGVSYGGRYFKVPTSSDIERINAAFSEWDVRANTDLANYWPRTEIPFGHMTHQRQPLPQHGYTHYYKMFNARQLLVHALILKAIDDSHGFSDSIKEVILGAVQQYLRNNNMFCFWNPQRDTPEPMFSNNNYHPKSTVIENSVFANLGRGNWASCRANTMQGLEWCKQPWELVSNEMLSTYAPELKKLISGKSEKARSHDPVLPGTIVTCGSSTELNRYEDNSFDLVITDPPFGGLLHYAELADFFYVWLRLLLKDKYSNYFSSEYTPKTLEVVSNRARHPENPDAFYKRLLTECWREANRMLKPGGILSFTFHHSEDAPWVDVLESLFDAGFYLEATYPIRSDETKGKGEFGSKTIEFDIIHVCRKRVEEPQKISWQRLRRQIMADVHQLQTILEHHLNDGLPKADIQVIKRGKALEYFSRHYGKVFIEEGREFKVKEALVGINLLLDDQSEGETGGTPVKCEPITRQFLRIFNNTLEVPRNQMQKFLRGTGIGPSDFLSRGWTEDKKKVFHWVAPLEFAQSRVENLKILNRDMDQAMVLIGACFPGSGINVNKLLNDDFRPHPALGDLLNWLLNHGASKEIRQAAITARQLYTKWSASHQQVVQKQLALFDLEEDE